MKFALLISIRYRDTKAQVITRDGDTEFLKILAGVLQGGSLVPFFFIITSEYVLREATKETNFNCILFKRLSSRHSASSITDTDFADDLALLSDCDYLKQALTLLHRLEVAAKAVGLHVNFRKNENMMYNQQNQDLFTHGGNKLKLVEVAWGMD